MKSRKGKPGRKPIGKLPKKPVQVSLDQGLLRKVDADKEVRNLGRSAFITQAILSYFRTRKAEELEARLAAAYGGREDEMSAEAEPFFAEQIWSPDDDLVEIHPPQKLRRAQRG